MEIHLELSKLPRFNKSIVTIGSFDGVHVGHRAILNKMLAAKLNNDQPTVVVTFHPHPRQILHSEQPPKILTTPDEKAALLDEIGIDHLVVIPFDETFSQIEPEDYIADFLVSTLQVDTLFVGYDHRFGRNRSGSIETLKAAAQKYGFRIVETEAQEVEEVQVSSTKIRRALGVGDIELANKLLSRAYSLKGQVVVGDQLGRTLGYPTANIVLNNADKLIPANGVYVVEVIHGGLSYGGLLNIGHRPTIGAHLDVRIEVHIFDFNADIYQQELEVKILSYLREEVKFDSIEKLRTQIEADEARARQYLVQSALNKTAVVILNYNTRAHLERFLPSVQTHTPPEVDIIVADNASDDDSVAWLRHTSNIKVLTNSANMGFAAGYNHFLHQIHNPYVVLLNSDVEVTAGWLEPLLAHMAFKPKVAAVQPKIRAADNRHHFEYAGAAGGFIDELGYPFCRGRLFDTCETDEGQYDTVQKIMWGSGAALVVRADVFKKLGGFEPTFFAHMEEIDWCWRARRAGYNIIVEPRSVVFHLGGGTMNYQNPMKTFLNFRNSLATLVRNENVGLLLWIIPIRLVLDGIAGVRMLLGGKPAHTWAIVRAHWSFFYRIPQLIRQRQAAAATIARHRIGLIEEITRPFSVVWAYFAEGRRTFKSLKF